MQWLFWVIYHNSPANIYLFKVNYRNTRKGVKYVYDVNDVISCFCNFKHISHLFSSASIIDFEQVNLSWVPSFLPPAH